MKKQSAPAELVPDSADLYMGADLLNRFFGSWMGDAEGKSPLEAARNVIVTYLTGPGLKVPSFTLPHRWWGCVGVLIVLAVCIALTVLQPQGGRKVVHATSIWSFDTMHPCKAG